MNKFRILPHFTISLICITLVIFSLLFIDGYNYNDNHVQAIIQTKTTMAATAATIF